MVGRGVGEGIIIELLLRQRRMVLTGAREGQGRPGLGWGGSKRRNVGYRTSVLTMLGMRLVDDRSGSIRGARSILVHVPQDVLQYALWYSVQQKKAGRANGPGLH